LDLVGRTEPAAGAAVAEPYPPQADTGTPRRWMVFGVLAIALFMVSVDQTIVATALHDIQVDLGAELSWTGWTITAYALGQIVTLPLAGRIGDQFGRRRVLLVAVAVFTMTSLCVGFAPNIETLVALRAVQALGGGAFMPCATGLIAEHFGPNRDRAVGMFTSIFPIGGMLGPVLGGVLVTYWSWRFIFLVNVPIGIVLLILAARIVTERGVAPEVRGRLDIGGVVLFGSTLLATMFALTRLEDGSAVFADPRFLVPAGLAVVTVTLFLRHARRHQAPFISMRLLKGRQFAGINVLNVLFGGAVMGASALVPLYAQERFGMDPLAAGGLLTARGVGMICTAALAVLALRHLGHRIPSLAGFVVLGTGLAMMAFAPPDGMTPFGWLALSTAISGVGMGLAVPAINNAGLQLAPDQLGVIAGLRGMFRQSGGILAISVTTAVVSGSAHPATTHAHTFLVLAGLIALALPLIFSTPEHKGNW
jgi:EmrB/QacA subfamily drug resistance transporter